MKFVRIDAQNTGVRAIVDDIVHHLEVGERVLWLIAGGSNIPIAKEIMSRIRSIVNPAHLSGLTVSETDERYGPVGHADSNWQQLIDTGFDMSGITCIPILCNMPLDQTVAEWSRMIVDAFDRSQAIIGQFGIGADGHIAGMLPHSPTIHDPRPASSFTDELYTRITLTPSMLRRLSSAYVFVHKGPKKQALADLEASDLSLDDEPAQILRSIPNSTVYVI